MRYRTLETQLQFRGEKYLNTFIVTNANDCPNLLSFGATFRMGVLLYSYPEENVVRGENVPNFKINTSEGTSSNVFQILQDLWLNQYQEQCHSNTMHIDSKMFHMTSTTNTIQNMAQLANSFRTTTPSTAMTGTKKRQQNRSIQYMHIQILHIRHHWDIAYMSTNLQFRFANQVNH